MNNEKIDQKEALGINQGSPYSDVTNVTNVTLIKKGKKCYVK